MNIKPLGVPFFKSESEIDLDALKRTHSMRFKRLKKILKSFGLLWQALRKFNDDNGFFLSSGIAFNILINLIPFILLLLAWLEPISTTIKKCSIISEPISET